MLISFSVENFLSIKEKITFTMEATKYKSDNLIQNAVKIEQIKLLKSAVIFGPNGSGKSNLIFAMKKMRDIVENSLKNDNIIPFKFDTIYTDKPTTFEVCFLYKNIIYRYGFSIRNGIVIEEWLYYKKNKSRARESQYFQRNYQEFKNFGDFKKEADLIKKENKTREDKLYLNVVAEFNGRISRNILNWFSTFNSFSSIYSNLAPYTFEKIRNEKQKERIIDFLRSADFGIVDLQEKSLSIDELEEKLKNDNFPLDLIEEIKKDGGLKSIETYHHKYENKKFVGLEPLSIGSESDGTKKLFELSGAIIEALDNGEILIIDELDNSFHTKMTEAIIKLFNSEKNIHNAQLIFASHDTNILTQKLFRRDQIWFTEKDIYGATHLYSLIDFGTRKDTSLEKNYLEGKYGSIPVITELEYDYE
jgi:AAA15 family ATPase/GTPase